MDAKSTLEAISGFLIPIIGIVTTYIAYQQYKTNKRRDRRESRQAQLSVYTRVKRFLNHVDTTREISKAAYTDITEAIAEADFLFSEDITDWLAELQGYADEYRQAEDGITNLRMHYKMLFGSLEELRARDPEALALLEGKISQAIDKLQTAHCELKEKFSKHFTG